MVSGTAGLAVETGMVERDNVDPVGEAQAIACGGLCLLGVATAAGVAIGAVGGGYIGANYLGDSDVNTTALEQADADEARKEVYTAGSVQQQNNRVFIDSHNNYAQDTQSIALMEGKNAYIRALENGSSEATARAEAKEAVSDYYAARQMQLINNWNTSIQTARNNNLVAEQHSNIDSEYVTFNVSAGSSNSRDGYNLDAGNRTVNLVNQTDVTVENVRYTVTYSGDGNSDTYNVYLGAGINNYDGPSNGGDSYPQNIEIQGPTSDYSKLRYHHFQDYHEAWTTWEQQNTEVHNKIDNFVDSTYSEYQEGDINTTDLVDPYLGAREYGPEENYGSWTLRSLISAGVNPPKDLSNTGTMTVTDHATGETREGILMSDGLPDSGEFEVGTTYHADNLTGVQYVVDGDSGTTHELTGSFTLDNATTDGNSTNSVAYEQVDYQTTNMDEFKALQRDLRNFSAQIESRQQRLRDGGGGGLFSGIGGSFGLGLSDSQAGAAILALLFVGLLALAAVSRN